MVGNSVFLSSWGGCYIWFLSSHVVLGPPLVMFWDDWSLVGMCRLASLLLQCAGDCSLVLAWDFSLDMVRVNSVVVVSSIPSSCGLLAPVYLCCEGCLYCQQKSSSLCVMSSRLLSSCSGGLLLSCGAVSSLFGVWVAPWEGSTLLVLEVPNISGLASL